MSRKNSENRQQKLRTGRIYYWAVFLALATTILIAPEVCDDKSMQPAIEKGQCVLVAQDSYSQKRGIPQEGTIVIMEKQYSLDLGAEDNIIARVCGQPGDTISAKDGILYRNGKEYELNGSSYCPGEFSVKVDDDSVFLLYDNRDFDGYDSRKTGPVSMREIKGQTNIVIWPAKDIKKIGEKKKKQK